MIVREIRLTSLNHARLISSDKQYCDVQLESGWISDLLASAYDLQKSARISDHQFVPCPDQLDIVGFHQGSEIGRLRMLFAAKEIVDGNGKAIDRFCSPSQGVAAEVLKQIGNWYGQRTYFPINEIYVDDKGATFLCASSRLWPVLCSEEDIAALAYCTLHPEKGAVARFSVLQPDHSTLVNHFRCAGKKLHLRHKDKLVTFDFSVDPKSHWWYGEQAKELLVATFSKSRALVPISGIESRRVPTRLIDQIEILDGDNALLVDSCQGRGWMVPCSQEVISALAFGALNRDKGARIFVGSEGFKCREDRLTLFRGNETRFTFDFTISPQEPIWYGEEAGRRLGLAPRCEQRPKILVSPESKSALSNRSAWIAALLLSVVAIGSLYRVAANSSIC